MSITAILQGPHTADKKIGYFYEVILDNFFGTDYLWRHDKYTHKTGTSLKLMKSENPLLFFIGEKKFIAITEKSYYFEYNEKDLFEDMLE